MYKTQVIAFTFCLANSKQITGLIRWKVTCFWVYFCLRAARPLEQCQGFDMFAEDNFYSTSKVRSSKMSIKYDNPERNDSFRSTRRSNNNQCVPETCANIRCPWASFIRLAFLRTRVAFVSAFLCRFPLCTQLIWTQMYRVGQNMIKGMVQRRRI